MNYSIDWDGPGESDYDEPCDHEDYDGDAIGGRAICYRCGHAWCMTAEEIAREHRHWAEYAQWEDEQYRRERWERLLAPWHWLRDRISGLFRRKQHAGVLDDEIPF